HNQSRGREMPDSDAGHGLLYEPTMELDACGVGFIADVKGRARRDVVVDGLAALNRLTHRGAPASLGAVDGCGVLTAIPWPLLESEIGHRLDGCGANALGMFFVARVDVERAIRTIERVLRDVGARSILWRPVKVDASAV